MDLTWTSEPAENNLRPNTCNGLTVTILNFFFFLVKYNKIQYTDLKLKKLQTWTLKKKSNERLQIERHGLKA